MKRNTIIERVRFEHVAFALVFAACKTQSISENNPAQIVVGLVEASTPEEQDAVPAAPSIAEITLSRSVCYGYCADYTVTVKSDGTVLYDGRQFVAKKGKATDKIPPADAEALVNKFVRSGFDRLSVPQDCPRGIATDNPTNVLVFKHDGKEHVVEHYLGNMCAPPVLAELAKAVDETAKTEKWVRCGPKPSDYCTKP